MTNSFNGFVPHTSAEWNKIWEEKQKVHKGAHNSDFWNKRAKSFTTKDAPGSYTDKFLQLANIGANDSVFDMGCGTGNLSIPLLASGHKVLSADFSVAMLARLDEQAEKDGLSNARTMELSWEDDWQAKGIEPRSFDVCIASRSIATDDIRSALLKLSSVARKHVCITLACGSSPRVDDRAIRDIGLAVHPSYDDVYAIAILQGEGFLPKLDYIKTMRADTFESFDSALEKYTMMIDASIAQFGANISKEEAVRRMRDWVHENLVETELPDGTEGVTLKVPRETVWAFLSWSVDATK